MENVGCGSVFIGSDRYEIGITAQYGVRFRNRLRSITTHCTGAAGPGGLKKIPHSSRPGECERSANRVIMESWFADAKRITSLDAEICFLLQDDFYYGPDSYPEVAERKEVEPLPSPQIERHVPSMVRSAEAVGHEEELAKYYREVIRVARKHRKSFNDIRQYFWMRFWLWNTDEEIHISFPWYDTYSEIDRFLTSVSGNSDGQLFWDADQGWELDVHALQG